MADPPQPQSQTTSIIPIPIPTPTTTPTQTPPGKAPRKFPAPCWTQEETIALIDSYRDRWYALRRGYLRTADWDAVSASIAARSPADGLAKTSAQCRHKMEKLRQRYRTEKQRSLSFPGRFLSNWFFFENMDSMENGPNKNVQDGVESTGVIRIKALVNDRPIAESVIGTTTTMMMNSKKKIGGNSSFGSDGIDPGDQNSAILGIRASKSYSPNFDQRPTNMYSSSYLYNGSDDDAHVTGMKPGKRQGIGLPDFDFNNTIHRRGGGGGGGGGGDILGFSANLPVNHNIVYTGYGSKKSGKVYVNNPDHHPDHHGYQQHNSGAGLCLKISGERISVPSGLRMKNTSDPFQKVENRGVKRGGGGGGCPIWEMASSIKMLGEGFVKMEKMKIEMAREVEKTRMEMEMKRNELIMESQRQIVDAFVSVLLETKSKKKKNKLETET